MKYILSILLCVILQTGFSQGIIKTVGISYTNGTPTYTPAKAGSALALDTVTWRYYTWDGYTWLSSGFRVQTISGCSAPAYTPTKFQSYLVINACTAGQGGPELYYWIGSAWLQINEGQTYTAGTGIAISVGNEISNTAPSKWTDSGAYTYLTATADRVLVGSSTELNTGYIFQANGSGIFTANGVFNNQNANKVTIGASSASSVYPGIWFGSATPNLSNYAFLSDVGANQTILNSPSTGNISFRVANVEFMRLNSTGLGIAALAPVIPTSKLDVSGATGYSQLRLREYYTPTSSADALGATGETAWDANYFYIKTAAGWKRVALSTF